MPAPTESGQGQSQSNSDPFMNTHGSANGGGSSWNQTGGGQTEASNNVAPEETRPAAAMAIPCPARGSTRRTGAIAMLRPTLVVRLTTVLAGSRALRGSGKNKLAVLQSPWDKMFSAALCVVVV